MNEGANTKEMEKKNFDLIDNKTQAPQKNVERRVKIVDREIIKIQDRKIYRFDNTVDYLEQFEFMTNAATGKTIGWDFPSMINGGESKAYTEDELKELVENFIELPDNAKFDELSGQTLSGNKVLCGSWIHYFNEKLIENDSIFIRLNPTTKKIISVRKYWYDED